jgi:hypothetical protein
MKTASWFLALILAATLLYGDRLLPKPGEEVSLITQHVSLRFTRQCGQETGLPQALPAVLADYRGFDLFTVSLLLTLAALFCLWYLGPKGHVPKPGGFFLSLAGLGGCLFLGMACLFCGSNFLDYEPLAAFFRPELARPIGMLCLAMGFLLALAGALAAFLKSLREAQEDFHDT